MSKQTSCKISVTINPVRQRALYADINQVEDGHRAARILELAAYALTIIHGQTPPLFTPQGQASPPHRPPEFVPQGNTEPSGQSRPNGEVAVEKAPVEPISGASNLKENHSEQLEKPLISSNNIGAIYGNSVPHKAIHLDINPDDIGS
ncbi:MAG: hypothetical protein Q7K26_01865 [bacterium]|nr:hypothetical protein [bacterium]